MPDNLMLREVEFAYGPAPLLCGITLSVTKGEIVVIGGRSGHGLTTLLELCVGLQHPQSGSVLWDGRDLALMTREQLLHERRMIGFMFQNGALISNHTVFDNIALPLRSRGRISSADVERRVRSEMETLMLGHLDACYPEALSVFQVKAVALARALIGDPSLLFLDDPLGGMDAQAARRLLDVIENRWKKNGMGIVMISHHLDPWPHLPIRRYALENGMLRMVEQGADTVC